MQLSGELLSSRIATLSLMLRWQSLDQWAPFVPERHHRMGTAGLVSHKLAEGLLGKGEGVEGCLRVVKVAKGALGVRNRDTEHQAGTVGAEGTVGATDGVCTC